MTWRKLLKNKKSADMAGIVIATILIVAGVIAAVIAVNSFDEAIEDVQDRQLSNMLETVDFNLTESVERFENQTERFIESDRFTSAVDEWLATGDGTTLKRVMQNSSVSNMSAFDAMFVTSGGAIAVSTIEGKLYKIGTKIEDNIYCCEDTAANQYLAVKCRIASDINCYSIIDIKGMYFTVLQRVNAATDSIMLLEPESQTLFGQKGGEIQTCPVDAVAEAKNVNVREGSLLCASEVQQTMGVKSYEKRTESGKLTTRVMTLPSSMTDNGIFAISASMEYDAVESLARTTATKLIVSFMIMAIGLALALLIFLRGRRKRIQVDLELEELKEKNRQMEALNQKTQELAHHQRLETIGTMTSSIAHEFNNLLTPIMGYSLMTLEQLSEDDDNGIYDGVLEIYNASLKAKDIISRLSELSRKNTETKFQLIEPDELVNKVIHVAAPLLPKNVDIYRKLRCSGMYIKGNETQLSQLVLNLIINAFQAMGDTRGEVTIITARSGDEIMLEVSDNGPGISETIREKIFDPFFTTKDPGDGTGLGLAIVLQAVEDHRGRIEVDSEEGKGSSFRVFIPEVKHENILEAEDKKEGES